MTEPAVYLTGSGKNPKLLSPCANEAVEDAFGLPLPESILNIEAKSRKNLFPWRGQFSPQLVEALLRAYAPPDSVVLDPFMGSGTVLVESARLGLAAYGCEVNPAAYLLARVYELCNLTVSQRLEYLDKAEQILIKIRPMAFKPPLLGRGAVKDSLSSDSYDWIRVSSDRHVRTLLEALIILVGEDDAEDKVYAQKLTAIRDIVIGLPYSQTPVLCSLGDARSLPFPDGAIDFVLSSPPYINVFNYHHNSRSAIESLGWKPLVIAGSEIGSNRKFRQNRFLIVVQYCIDMALALTELRRVCTSDARIILILGRESNVHKTAFYNGTILERLATEITDFQLHLRQQRVFVNRFGKEIFEDLLHLSPRAQYAPPRELTINRARRLASSILAEALNRVPSDRMRYLHDAIDRVNEIDASPIFEPETAIEGTIL